MVLSANSFSAAVTAKTLTETATPRNSLASFPGWHGVEDALAYGVKVTGCTVHIATEEVDAGPILAQEAVVVEPEDTVESLHERIKAVERRIYVQTISAIIERGSVQ